MQAIPAFYRYNVRVEMRCSTAFERPSIGDGLGVALTRLEQAGLLSRMHGGAILKRRMIEEPLYATNVRAHSGAIIGANASFDRMISFSATFVAARWVA